MSYPGEIKSEFILRIDGVRADEVAEIEEDLKHFARRFGDPKLSRIDRKHYETHAVHVRRVKLV